MRDSQKETPNRTSCGCKIPRCQELKIAATGPSSGKGAGLLRRPEDRLCGSHIQACCCTAAEPATLQSPGPDRPEAASGQPNVPGPLTWQPSLCLLGQLAPLLGFGRLMRTPRRDLGPLERGYDRAPESRDNEADAPSRPSTCCQPHVPTCSLKSFWGT